ncbi:MAG: DMT family transporter [Bacilli bacterium]|nr:DMT family transporter [Bacilli bacterium]MDD4056624.1 DMT family transporter [Bacilli bacterium]
MNKKTLGNLLALFTVMIWGTTFVVTKNLLNDFKPIEILLYRFTIAFVALLVAYPKIFTVKKWKHEVVFALAGLSGVAIYQFLENTALTYTSATNASIITSMAPFFTAILSFFVLKDEGLTKRFIVGFIISILGVILVTFNGMFVLELNPFGDLLLVIAVMMWATYSVVTKIASKYGYHMVQVTRRITMYGIIFITPIYLFSHSDFDISKILVWEHSLSIAFLGFIASALCFSTWNIAVKHIGAVKTTVYIYAIPVVTIIFSAIFLQEKLTWMGILGAALTIIGLIISTRKNRQRSIVIEDE